MAIQSKKTCFSVESESKMRSRLLDLLRNAKDAKHASSLMKQILTLEKKVEQKLSRIVKDLEEGSYVQKEATATYRRVTESRRKFYGDG